MDIESFMTLVSLILGIICYVGMKWCDKHECVNPKKYRIEYWIKRKGGF